MILPWVLFLATNPVVSRAIVTVSLDRPLGDVNRFILGNNVETAAQGDPELSATGRGVWRPETHAPAAGVLALARKAGIASLRFPGGCGAHYWDWRTMVGPLSERPRQAFGIPEFLQMSENLGAQSVITLGIFGPDKTPAHFADLVEYLNAPIGTNPNGGVAWAEKRAADGHPAPHGLTLFELDNETYHGGHQNHYDLMQGRVERMDSATYAARFRAIRNAMQGVDPHIQLGAVLGNESDAHLSPWTDQILSYLGAQADFFITHLYLPSGLDGPAAQSLGTDTVFRLAMAAPVQLTGTLQLLRRRIRESAGRDVPLAITEHNIGLAFATPPWRFSLGAAIHTADTVGILLDPQLGILAAHYWHLTNGFWGQIKGDDPYVSRPAQHVFSLWSRVGDKMVATDVVSGTFSTPGGLGVHPAHGVPEPARPLGREDWMGARWQIVADRDGDFVTTADDAGGLTVAIRATQKPRDYRHARMTFSASAGVSYRMKARVQIEGLNGANARFWVGDGRGWEATRSGTDSGPLVSGAEREVVVEYTGRPDGTEGEIILRRPAGTTSGTIKIRSITVQAIAPAHLGAVPVLAAYASVRGRDVTTFLINRGLVRTQSVRIRGIPAGKARATVMGGVPPETDNESKEIIETRPLNVRRMGRDWVLDLPPCSFAVVEVKASRSLVPEPF